MDEDTIYEIEKSRELIEEIKECEEVDDIHDTIHSYDLPSTTMLYYLGLNRGMSCFCDDIEKIKIELIEHIESDIEDLLNE